jgi:hypothetical protein
MFNGKSYTIAFQKIIEQLLKSRLLFLSLEHRSFSTLTIENKQVINNPPDNNLNDAWLKLSSETSLTVTYSCIFSH